MEAEKKNGADEANGVSARPNGVENIPLANGSVEHL
jgi:hypothetical protein